MELEIKKENLKPGNFITICYDSEYSYPNKATHTFKIMSELKKVVVLENMLEISKETLRGWNFIGDILKIESN